jgi:hypothetical protein
MLVVSQKNSEERIEGDAAAHGGTSSSLGIKADTGEKTLNAVTDTLGQVRLAPR